MASYGGVVQAVCSPPPFFSPGSRSASGWLCVRSGCRRGRPLAPIPRPAAGHCLAPSFLSVSFPQHSPRCSLPLGSSGRSDGTSLGPCSSLPGVNRLDGFVLYFPSPSSGFRSAPVPECLVLHISPPRWWQQQPCLPCRTSGRGEGQGRLGLSPALAEAPRSHPCDQPTFNLCA